MIKNLFFFKKLNYLGGTEQFLYEIAKKYSKDFHIVVAYEDGSTKQVKRLSEYVDIIKWKKGTKIECEKAFLNFNIEIIDDLICDDITFICHAIYEEIGYQPPSHPRLKRCIAVSDFTKDNYEKHYDIPCELSYNPITIEDFEKPLILMSAFRADDPVRGSRRCNELAKRLDIYCTKHNKRYLWFIFSPKPSVQIESPNVVIIEPRLDVRAYMPMADWGINLANNMETYGYTNVEFLMQGVPLVTTPLSVCEELHMDSSMRLVVDYDLSNMDEIIEQMFTRKMGFNFTPPEDRWSKILALGQGEIQEKLKMKLFKVRANSVSFDRGIHLSELGRPAKPGEEFETTEDRLDNLVNGNNKFSVPFAELIEEIKVEKKVVKDEPKEEPKEEKVVPEEEAKPKKTRKKKE